MVTCSIHLIQISPVLFVCKLWLSFVGSLFVSLAALIRSFSSCGVLPSHHLSFCLAWDLLGYLSLWFSVFH